MTETDVAAIRRWWLEGLTMREIGERLGYHYTTIGKAVHRLGLPYHYHHYNDDDVSRMREMREGGATYREIAAEFGCGERTVDYYLRVRGKDA